MTGHGSYQWRGLPITTLRTLIQVIRFSSWTVATTLGCRTRKRLTPTSSPNQQVSYQRNSECWWLCAEKISTMPRSFKNEHTIRESNLKATLLVRTFSWTTSISRSSATESWRQSSLGRSECSILSESKPTS